MKITRRTKLLVVALVLCMTTMIGSTLAWFTDTVESANNVITAGNLDIVVEYKTQDMTEWANLEGAPNLFKNSLWEPGHTEVVYLKITNAGTLALNYKLAANIVEETAGTNVADETFKLSNYLKFKAAESTEPIAAYNSGKEAIAAATAEIGVEKSMAAKTATTTDIDYVAMVVYMPETVGNEANPKTGTTAPTITLGVMVDAKQKAEESDSFGTNYDANAFYPAIPTVVESANALTAALEKGGVIVVNGTMNANSTQDVPGWTDAPAEYIIDATQVSALSGGVYQLEQASRYGIVARISAGESLALSNMNVTANSQWPVYLSNYGGTLTVTDVEVEAEAGAGVYPYGTAGTTTLKNVKVNQNRLDPAYASSTPWAATAVATSNGHNLIIESGTYVGSSWAVYGYNSGSTITINGGTFKADKVIQLDGVWSGTNKSVATINGGSFDGAIHLDWGDNPPELYINGGRFTNFSATVNGKAVLSISGGTFDADPSAYVAAGYKATESDGTWTVTAE